MGAAFARVGLLGNPSDGYGGKTLAAPVRDFSARVEAAPAAHLTIDAEGPAEDAAPGAAEAAPVERPAARPLPDLRALASGDPDEPLDDVLRTAGVDAGTVDGLDRLVLAAAVRLARTRGVDGLPAQPPALTCRTTVPRQVGLAGSSAVILATLRALAPRWGMALDPFEQSELALAVETRNLGIAAGPQDRVVQAYETLLVMDFAPPRGPGRYRPMDAALLPDLAIAWAPGGGRSSGVTHSDLRARWEAGEAIVVETMRALGELVDRGVEALERSDKEAFADAVDENLALRLRVTGVGVADRAMIDIAREAGAAAKLCGSGGAVLVVPRLTTDLAEVERRLREEGYRSCRPEIV